MTITSSALVPPAPPLVLAPFAAVSPTRARLDRRGALEVPLGPLSPVTSTSSSSSARLMGSPTRDPAPSVGAERRVPASCGGGVGSPFVGRWIARGRDPEARLAAGSGAGGGGAMVSVLGSAYLAVSKASSNRHVTHILTHSRAVWSCFLRFFLYSWAMEGTRGSAGLGSVRREERERTTL